MVLPWRKRVVGWRLAYRVARTDRISEWSRRVVRLSSVDTPRLFCGPSSASSFGVGTTQKAQQSSF